MSTEAPELTVLANLDHLVPVSVWPLGVRPTMNTWPLLVVDLNHNAEQSYRQSGNTTADCFLGPSSETAPAQAGRDSTGRAAF